MTLSRLINILVFIATFLLFLTHYGAGFIPVSYMPFIAAGAAAISAFTERIQGGKSTVTTADNIGA